MAEKAPELSPREIQAFVLGLPHLGGVLLGVAVPFAIVQCEARGRFVFCYRRIAAGAGHETAGDDLPLVASAVFERYQVCAPDHALGG